jgi:hypothetical protein
LHGTGGGHFTDDDIFGSKEEGLMKEKIWKGDKKAEDV